MVSLLRYHSFNYNAGTQVCSYLHVKPFTKRFVRKTETYLYQYLKLGTSTFFSVWETNDSVILSRCFFFNDAGTDMCFKFLFLTGGIKRKIILINSLDIFQLLDKSIILTYRLAFILFQCYVYRYYTEVFRSCQYYKLRTRLLGVELLITKSEDL